MVDDFINKLKESPLYAVDTDNLKRTVPNDQFWAFEFEVPLILKPPGQITATPSPEK